jgi:hypothetical protein
MSMAAGQPSNQAGAADPTKVIQVSVLWESSQDDPPTLLKVQPPAEELAGILLGLEQTYQALASALGYPPHFSKIVAVRNPTLTFDLKGGKEIIEAVEQLIFALPGFVASLFRPRAVIGLADLQTTTQAERLKADAAAAKADAADADRRRAEAELETSRIRREMDLMPLRPDPAAHALLAEVVRQVQATDPAKRALIGDTFRYLAATHEYQPSSHVLLVTAQPDPTNSVSPTIGDAPADPRAPTDEP